MILHNDFRSWKLDSIDEYFDTKEVRILPSLENLMSIPYTPNDFERQALSALQENYIFNGDDWNEVELENKFISPLFVFANIDNEKFAYFMERRMEATINGISLLGYVDGMIASGYRSPKKPYFCLNEYKRQSDPNGDPRGQTLIAMLVAQAHNNDNNPIFGCCVIGKQWQFLALEGKHYAFSNAFLCTNVGIFDIFRILKGLRVAIATILDTQQS